MAIKMYQGSLPHIYHMDLKNDGVFVECAVMKKDRNGNVFFFPVNALDPIDKRRLAKILNNRNANTMELWDLMDGITLNNGVNALTYFHQLVRMITGSGREMRPQPGVTGMDGVIDTRGEDARRDMEEMANAAANAAATAAARAATEAVRATRQPQPVANPQPVQESANPAPKRRGGRAKKDA